MIYTDFKNKVDQLMNLLFGAGVANHSTIIEQINYLVFLRSLSKRDDDAIKIGKEVDIVFNDELSKYRWENLLVLNADALFGLLEEIYERLPVLSKSKTIQQLYRDAHVKVYDKPTLRRLVHEIENMMADLEKEASKGHTDIFGDMYEYLLSKLAQAGTLGSFRTPRHIIKFMVDVIDPSKGETLLDPACGTAGFLVAALEHLKHKYTSKDFINAGKFPMNKIDPKERKFILQHALTGFDSDFDMFKFGLMNLYLHQVEHPNIKRLNTLVDTAGNREKWDVILANPPFAGALDQDSISEDIRMGTRATEILFLRFMIDHVSPNGRVGVVVPEGIIFSGSNAHKKIRQLLLEEAGLWCVVSLPAGVFNPYAGVKTSILFFDKNMLKKAKDVLFVKINNDGFDLGATKRPIEQNDLPLALEIIKNYLKEIGKFESSKIKKSEIAHLVPKEKILASGDFNLSRERYKVSEVRDNQKWPMVELGEVAELVRGVTYSKKDEVASDGYEVLRANNISLDGMLFLDDIKQISKNVAFKDKQKLKANDIFICLASGSKAHIGKVAYIEIDTKYYFGGFMGAVRTFAKMLDPKYLFYLLRSNLFNEYLENTISGANINNLSISILLAYKIPLPPIDIQKQIVEEIDGYQKIIDGARQVVDNWKPVIKVDPGWERVKIGDLCELYNGKAFKPKDWEKEESGGLPIVRIQNLNNEQAKYNFFTGETDNQVIINTGDLLFSWSGSRGTSFGPHIWKGPKAILNQHIFKVVHKSIILKEFFFLILEAAVKEVEENLHGGVGLVHITKGNLERILVPLPSLEIQKQIIAATEEEKQVVGANKKLIGIFEQKIMDRLAEVWG